VKTVEPVDCADPHLALVVAGRTAFALANVAILLAVSTSLAPGLAGC
jgi:hypothetical protein